MYTRYRDNRILFLVELIIEEKGVLDIQHALSYFSKDYSSLFDLSSSSTSISTSSALSAAPLIVKQISLEIKCSKIVASSCNFSLSSSK